MSVRFGSESKQSSAYIRILWLGVLGVCVLTTLGTLVVVFEQRERSQLATRMAKLSAEGAPVDDSSLAALYHSRTSTEMQAQWSRVFALARRETESSASGDDQAIVQRLTQLRKEITAAIKSDRPNRFIEDFEAIYTSLPHLSKLRATTTLLANHAQAAINLGEIEMAIEDCDLILGCADAISADPFAIPCRLSLRMQSDLLDVYRTCLEKDLLSKEQLYVLQKTCRLRGPIGDRWKLAISGERAGVLALITDSVYEESHATQDPYLHWISFRGKAANNIANHFDSLVAIPTDDLQACEKN